MPTKERRLNFVVNPLLMEYIDEYRFSHKIDTLSDALRELIKDGLRANKKEAPGSGPSKDAMRLAKVYDELDIYGKKAVNQTAEGERERVEDQQRERREAREGRRFLAARDYQGAPMDPSAAQSISIDEVEKIDLDL